MIAIAAAAAIFTIVTGAATVLGWLSKRSYQRGQEDAQREAERKAQVEAAAKIRTLEARLTEVQAELDALASRRRRA